MIEELEQEVARLGRIVRQMQCTLGTLGDAHHRREGHPEPERWQECADEVCQELWRGSQSD